MSNMFLQRYGHMSLFHLDFYYTSLLTCCVFKVPIEYNSQIEERENSIGSDCRWSSWTSLPFNKVFLSLKVKF